MPMIHQNSHYPPTGDAFAVGTKLKSQLSDRELVVTINGIEDLELKCLSGLVLA